MAADATPDTPFIFVSGSIGEERAVDRLKDGATDYVLKDRMARLPSAVRRALAEAAERAERRRAEADVRRLNAELERRVIERTMELAESQRRLQAILDYSPARLAERHCRPLYPRQPGIREPRRSHGRPSAGNRTPTFLRRVSRRSTVVTTPRCCIGSTASNSRRPFCATAGLPPTTPSSFHSSMPTAAPTRCVRLPSTSANARRPTMRCGSRG